jgi:ankyrin repeat protein
MRVRAIFMAAVNGDLPTILGLLLGSEGGQDGMDQRRPLLSVNVQCADIRNRTLLQVAAECGYVHLARHFVQVMGADTEVKDDDGFTALQLALIRGHTSVVQYLLSATARQPALAS